MFPKKITICILSILGLLPSAAMAQRELHVAPPPLGANSHPGTLDQPLATILSAERMAQPGDTIQIHEGVYRESVRFLSSGTPARPIALQAYDDGSGPAKVILSGFDLIQPGVNGVGQWQRHNGAIHKIQLTPDHGLSIGESSILIDGEIQKIARWPNAPSAFDFDWKRMASPESATHDTSSGAPEPPYEGTFFTASYNDLELPGSDPDFWKGARIDTSSGGGVFQNTGLVTASGPGSVTFRYRPFPASSQFASESDPYFLWNHLNALDEEGEYFFDMEGINGPPFMLYLWTPGGASPETMQVEMKRRDYAFNFNWVSDVSVRNITFYGAGVECPPSSSSISLEDLTMKYCGRGLDRLANSPRAAIWLKGANHSVRNCDIDSSYGGGILTLGTGTRITNNVVNDCMLYSVGTWHSSNIDVLHNTTFRNGDGNINMYSPGSRFNYNHCYHAGLRTTDVASMNSHYMGDLDEMEVAYNWVHSNVSRYNPERITAHGHSRLVWGGGRGIRLDRNPSNVIIHHNLIWNISAPAFSMVLWSLDENQTNYRDSKIRAYNNTVDGLINIPGSGSIGGHDIRNNICTDIREFGVELPGHIIRSNVFTVGSFLHRWPGEGNLFNSNLFTSAPTGNFELHSRAAAIDAGEHIPGITDGTVHGIAPDAGALEYRGEENPYWAAGALIRPRDRSDLRFSMLVKPGGERFIVMSGLPKGRVPSSECRIQLGSEILAGHRLTYSTRTHQARAHFSLQGVTLTGIQPVAISLDNGPFRATDQTVDLTRNGLSIESLSSSSSSPAGGTTHTITGNGFGSRDWMMPLRMVNTTGADLNEAPVPVIFDSKRLIEEGRMNPDCSDLRVIHWETNRQLRYWIESGERSRATLMWIKGPEELLLSDRFSHLDESSYFLTYGDSERPSRSDRSILTDYYRELDMPELEVWVSASNIAGTQPDGASLSFWPNSGAGAQLTQPDETLQPRFKADGLNGFPTVHFNGSNFMKTTGFPGILSQPDWAHTPGYTVLAVIKSDPHDPVGPNGRLVSIGNGVREPTYVRTGPTTGWRVLDAKRAYNGAITKVGIGRRFAGSLVPMTADLSELLVFSTLLTDAAGYGVDRVRKYLERKYALADSARGVVDPSRERPPTQFYIGRQLIESVRIEDGQTATFTAPPLGLPYRFFGFRGLASAIYGQLMLGPMSLELSVQRGNEVARAPEEFLFYQPAYETWAERYLQALEAGALQDPDGDHLSNLLEFATGSSPTDPSPSPLFPCSDPDTGLPCIRFYRNTAATDVFLTVEYSHDLQNWTALRPGDPRITVADPNPSGDGSRVLMQVAADPSAAHMCYRIRAEKARP